MEKQNQAIAKSIQELRSGFDQNQNLSYKQRIHHLELLENMVHANEQAIMEALSQDFNKPAFETFLTEIYPVLDEIRHFKKHLRAYMQPERVGTPIQLLPASGKIYHEPKGVVLVIGAWNYPVNLTLMPVVAALAAGNTVLLKPSEIASHTSSLLFRLVRNSFPRNVLHVIEGDGEFTSKILDHRFSHIFYTGSSNIGKIVYQKAAVHLCPVTLELGGKSPAFFHESANFRKGVKRLLWGKFLNGGQTCVAPDYALVPIQKKEEFLKHCKAVMQKFYAADPEKQSAIINEKHFERITKLLEGNQVIHFGGKSDASRNYIEPTVVEIFGLEHPLMGEEIFGPLLPVYFYKDSHELRDFYENSPNPLALYIFSTSQKFTNHILENYPAGGVLINDVMMHLANPALAFGGRGSSGFGNYHGKFGFDTFSHTKSVMKQANWIDPSFRYPPFTPRKLSFLKRMISFLHRF